MRFDTSITFASSEKREEFGTAFAQIGKGTTSRGARAWPIQCNGTVEQVLSGQVNNADFVFVAGRPSDVSCVFSLPIGYERQHGGEPQVAYGLFVCGLG
jgi:hypothetical protein